MKYFLGSLIGSCSNFHSPCTTGATSAHGFTERLPFIRQSNFPFLSIVSKVYTLHPLQFGELQSRHPMYSAIGVLLSDCRPINALSALRAEIKPGQVGVFALVGVVTKRPVCVKNIRIAIFSARLVKLDNFCLNILLQFRKRNPLNAVTAVKQSDNTFMVSHPSPPSPTRRTNSQ